MAIGDQNDMFLRLKNNLVNWFGPITPKLNALLQGPALTDSFNYSQIEYVRLQTRIQSATDVNLDYIALDFFGHRITRHNGESDSNFRIRILANVIPLGATRLAMFIVLLRLTGRPPVIIEPFDGTYIGAYDQTLYYDVNGGYGWLEPYTAIIYVFRPSTPRDFQGGGFDTTGSGMSERPDYFGYDYEFINQYIDLSQAPPEVSDDDILALIEATKVFGTFIYTFILD